MAGGGAAAVVAAAAVTMARWVQRPGPAVRALVGGLLVLLVLQ